MEEQKRVFTDEERTEIIQKYNEGITSNILAEKYHCTTSELRKELKSNSIHVSEEDKQGILADYLEGYSPTIISEKYGVNCQTVRDIAKQSGLSPSDRKSGKCITKRELHKRSVFDLYAKDENMTIEDVHAILGWNLSYVHTSLHNYPPTRDKYVAEITARRHAGARYTSVTKRNQEMYRKRCEGKTVKELAEEYNLSIPGVYKALTGLASR